MRPEDITRIKPHSSEPSDEFGLDLTFVLAALRRRYPIILCAGFLGFVLAIAVAVTSVPVYTSTARILVGVPEAQGAQDIAGIAGFEIDESALNSHVELLLSTEMSRKVVERLNLTENPRFMNPIDGDIKRLVFAILRPVVSTAKSIRDMAIAGIMGKAQIEAPALFSEDERLVLDAIRLLRENLNVERVPRTLVVTVSVSSQSPRLAAVIANEFAETFMDDQLEAKYEATSRTSQWLQTRTDELRDQAVAAEEAVELYKRDNELITASGELIVDQQLESTTTELVEARSNLSNSRGLLDQIQAIVDSGDTSAVLSGTISQSITSDLRARFLDANKRYSEISELLGLEHAQSVRLRNEMSQLQRLMFEEVKRYGAVVANDIEIAQSRIVRLEEELQKLVGTANETNKTLLELRELERNADSLRRLYTTFLARYQESLQAQSFEVSEARVISVAQPSIRPTQPRPLLMAALGGVLGLGLGIVVSGIFEFKDRVFRTIEHVRSDLRIEFLGMLPNVGTSVGSKSRGVTGQPHLISDEMGRSFAGTVNSVASGFDYSLVQPLSSYTETLRSIKVAADIALPKRSGRVIAVVSALPNEGKTLTVKNLASFFASQGAKTLLIDGDIRNPSLTRGCAGEAQYGLVQALSGEADWRSLLYLESRSGLRVLPGRVNQSIAPVTDILSSSAFEELVTAARAEYDYVLLDMAPLGPVVDFRAILELVDAFVLVIEWGKTSRSLVANVLQGDPRLHEKLLGAVYNRVNPNKIKMYDTYSSSGYYYKNYNKYYQSIS